MKPLSLISFVLCVVLAAASTENDGLSMEPLIVGGQKAQKGQFPYQASLRDIVTRSHFCGASIISERFLLTAAHCTTGLHSVPALMVAVVGAIHIHFDGTTMFVNKIFRHKGWDSNALVDDIALLRTSGKIGFTQNIQPIALPEKNTDGNTQVIYSGWGQYKGFEPNLWIPYTLNWAEAHTITRQECIDEFGTNQGARTIIYESVLCVKNKMSVGACYGDSGGPLVDVTDPAKKVLVGITSWVIPCAIGDPDVFTRVYSYLDWINENMAKNA